MISKADSPLFPPRSCIVGPLHVFLWIDITYRRAKYFISVWKSRTGWSSRLFKLSWSGIIFNCFFLSRRNFSWKKTQMIPAPFANWSNQTCLLPLSGHSQLRRMGLNEEQVLESAPAWFRQNCDLFHEFVHVWAPKLIYKLILRTCTKNSLSYFSSFSPFMYRLFGIYFLKQVSLIFLLKHFIYCRSN